MLNQKLHDELTVNLNKYANQFIIRNLMTINAEIEFTFAAYLNYNYYQQKKIWDYRVKSNYPKVEIYIQYHNREFAEIKLIRFERKQKLSKIETISKTL